MTETKWTNIVCTHARKLHGANIRVLQGSIIGEKGWPDRLIICQGFIFLVEFKGVETKIEPLQKSMLKKLHFQNKGSIFLARKLPSPLPGGIILHPVTEEPLGTFKDNNLIPALKEAREFLLKSES